MKGRPVEELVFECMFPKLKSNDPPNFHTFLQRSLIPEVRQETHAFYGHLETQEAKYPGLDYTQETHRTRLSRWPWHRRLFRAFSALGLTQAEILGLTKWEGTRWAKEKYESEQGVTIRDTTADGFPDHARRHRSRPRTASGSSLNLISLIEAAIGGRAGGRHRRENGDEIDDDDDDDDNNNNNNSNNNNNNNNNNINENANDDNNDDDDDDNDESDAELASVGLELNQRLRTQAARREAGDSSVVLDEEWEQWLKYAIETGELTLVTEHLTEHMFRRATATSSFIPAALIPPTMLSAARAGHWSQVPHVLHPILRRTLDAEAAAARQDSQRASLRRQPPPENASQMRVPWPRRTYSDLRLPLGDVRARDPRPTEAPGA